MVGDSGDVMCDVVHGGVVRRTDWFMKFLGVLLNPFWGGIKW